MFRETLLESSASGRKYKRWPMMAAFTMELIVGAALIALPLLSTGVIPVSARVSVIAPLGRANATRPPVGHPSAGGATLHVAILNVNRSCIARPDAFRVSARDDDSAAPDNIGVSNGLPSALADPHSDSRVPVQEKKPPERVRVSVINEGQLINKVDPVYPRTAIITGTKGDVRLHAVIAKDGTIQSLTVVSGPPLLIAAARDAVSQWRYRPYLLNGQPVEVETLITVTFKGTRD